MGGVQSRGSRTARMKLAFLALVAVLLTVPAAAQEAPRFTLEHRLQLRCSAAFAIVAAEQQRGVASALAHPPLGERGREYFARTGARLMDDLKLTREQAAESLRAEVEALRRASGEAVDPAGYLDAVMQPCLSALEASGL
jgi:hypothetical protein